jgi:hypothetical protein
MDSLSVLVSTSHYAAASCEPVEEGMGLDVEMTRHSETLGEEEEEVTWNHTGQAACKSIAVSGHMDVETIDEVTNDSVCGTEAISGSTRFTTSEHTAAVHYDGATDCSEESTVTWTLDGDVQGEISGVACSTTANGRGLSGVLLSMGVLLIFRRRD